MAATALVRYARRHRRAAGFATTLDGICLDRALGPSTTAPWFGPVFFSKLLLGHAGATLWSDATLAGHPRKTPGLRPLE